MSDEKVLLAKITDEEAESFQKLFNKKAAIKSVICSLTEELASVEDEESKLWKEVREKYQIKSGAFHVNTAEKAIYDGFVK
jgi:hypothetical protein